MVNKLDAFLQEACDWLLRCLVLALLAAIVVGVGYCLYTFITNNVLKFFTL